MGEFCGGKLSLTTLTKMKPYILMVCLQFGAAGMYIISMVTLNHGMNRYVLIVYRNGIAALVLAPFALVLERKIRPKMTLPIFLQIMALGCLEPILDQGFSYLGMQYTSASYTSAIMNAVPSVTFIIALIFRLERVNLSEIRSVAKVIGTVVTFGGALLMTIYKGPIIDFVWSRNSSHHGSTTASDNNQHWLAGTLLILVGCVSWSAFYVLQSVTLKRYPAELSLSSLICLSGTFQSLAIALVVAHHPGAWAVGWDCRLFAPVYSVWTGSTLRGPEMGSLMFWNSDVKGIIDFSQGIISSGITYYVQGLVMKERGPVFVTAFNPLCMIIVAALGSAILAEKIHLGSIIGGVIIAIGLYCVVWGKGKDYSSQVEATNGKDDAKELPITIGDDVKLSVLANSDVKDWKKPPGTTRIEVVPTS